MFFVILRLNVYQMFKQLINNITYSMINLFKHLIIYTWYMYIGMLRYII